MSEKPRGTIIITGASRGIGAATALLAGDAGYDVCVNYRQDREAAATIVSRILQRGHRAISVAADVSSENDVKRLFDTSADELGPLSALVNNAAVLETQSAFLEIDAARLQRILQVNVVGCFLCAQEAVRRMSLSSGGHGGGIVEVARAILWLLSDEAGYAVGTVIDVAGGV